jgi:hypothetical protein
MRAKTKRLLLTSVFKPFAVDDAFGVKENVCELMHNQVTRLQGVFSIRSQNRSFGLSFIAENLRVPTTVLDFPTQDEFVAELHAGQYTHVGISFIVPNVDKARRLCELTRRHAPGATIIVGGHGARIPGIKEILCCDEVCIGEGTTWLRRYFGEPVEAPFRHPVMPVDCARRLLGVPAPHRKAILIPGVGCQNRCSFCATSHFFGGYTSFFRTTRDLFEAMVTIADRLDTEEFFVLDENFLDDPARVAELLALMEASGRWFRFDIFSSLRAISQYDPLTLVRLGVHFVWIGIESRRHLFDKVQGLDAPAIIGALRAHGLSVLASTILFLDHHDHETIWADVDYTISLSPDFIQFMELAPLPGTTLYEDLDRNGRIRHEIPMQQWHGQDLIWFHHPHFRREETKQILDEAFRRDYLTLGPSLLRIAETRINALKHPPAPLDAVLERRYRDLRRLTLEMRPLLGSLAAMAPSPAIRAKVRRVQQDFAELFGPPGLADLASQAVVHLLARLEARRGRRRRQPWQPATFRQTFNEPTARDTTNR